MLISEKHKLVCCSDYISDDIRSVISFLEFVERDELCENCKKIILISNPYQKVLNLYMNTVLPPITPIFKDSKDDYIEYFRKWVSKMFVSEKLIIKLKFENTIENYTKQLNQLKIKKFNYDFIVRDDKLLSDLIKINKSFGDFNFELKNRWDIREFYDFKTAKIIFNFYKNEFLIGEYDPFSFSNTFLSKDDKVGFIHQPF